MPIKHWHEIMHGNDNRTTTSTSARYSNRETYLHVVLMWLLAHVHVYIICIILFILICLVSPSVNLMMCYLKLVVVYWSWRNIHIETSDIEHMHDIGTPDVVIVCLVSSFATLYLWSTVRDLSRTDSNNPSSKYYCNRKLARARASEWMYMYCLRAHTYACRVQNRFTFNFQ